MNFNFDKFKRINNIKYNKDGTIDLTDFVNIKDYEGIYMINKFGVIINIRNNKTNLMYPYKKSNGYLQINFYKNGIKTRHYVHRLVAKTFIPNPYNLPQVNHKDRNPSNNNVDNLEWCDNSYNVLYSNIPEKLKELRGDKIEITNIKTGEVIIARSKREAAELIDGSDTGIAYSINSGSVYKNKYKLKILSYGCK